MYEKTHDSITVIYTYQLGRPGIFASPVNLIPSPNFIKSAFMYRILTLLIVLCMAPFAVAQTPATLAEQPIANGNSNGNSIQFSFDKADWKDVIPWFAEQTGYSWQPISEWPEGTFTLSDDQNYSPMEALDQINYALRLRQPPYTIIRNRNQLILTEASQPLPEELIETITPAQLDQRGDYEIVTCHFSLGDIDVATVEQDLRLAISQPYQQFAKVLPSANEFHARDTGANLRKVRDTIVAMTKRKATSFSTYALKFYDPEQFLMVSRRLLGIADEAYQREDGSLVIVVDPSSNRLILKGTPTAIDEFKSIAAVVDVQAKEEELNTERPYLKNYPIFTDPEIARKVMETMLDGTDATVGQDETTGAIILRGRKEHHELAAETIATLRGESGTTKIIQLENSSASTILSAVQSLMNLTTDGENPKGPKLLANTLQNYIVVRGTPAEIFETTETILQLDQAQQLDPDRVRTNARIIKMAPSKRDDLIDAVEDYWPATGRKNSLRIIMPEDRKKAIGGLRRFGSPNSDSQELQQSDIEDLLAPPLEPSARDEAPSAPSSDGNNKNDKVQTRHSTKPIASPPSAFAASGLTHLTNLFLTSAVAYQPQEEAEPSPSGNSDYIPPESRTSVPGSPVVIKGTAFGILIESDDLDALDDLETILLQEVGEEGTDQGLTVFYLKYKKAASIKSAIEMMFGLGGGSSGGGGGDLLSGIVGNMAGGGAGDLLGGVLGGGTSSSGAVISLEGDVQVGMYVPLNLIYISGATQSDLEVIQDAIDTFDQPTAPQDPELAGQFYAIEIKHRDPEEVMTRIQNLMADYIQTDEQAQQSDSGNAPEQMAKMMRRMAGGGGDDGGSEPAQDQPKIRLDLDEETDQILITGPEFIYKQVKALVQQIDTPSSANVKRTKMLPSGMVTAATLKIIQERFGGKVVTVAEGDQEEGDSGQTSAEKAKGATNKASKAAQDAANKQREAQRQQAAEFFRSMRAGGQRGGGGGQRGGGGGQRGGGGGGQRGGGGRGR